MASFTDLHLWYCGAAPYALIKMALEELTASAIVIVDYASADSLAMTLCHCNDDYVDKFVAKVKAFATLADGDLAFSPPECTVTREWRQPIEDES